MADFPPGVGLTRRALLKATLLAGGGLALGFTLPVRSEAAPDPASGQRPEPGPSPSPTDLAPNAWIRILGDGRIELALARSEMGQGVMTTLPTLLAEELEVGLDQIEVVPAPVAPVYRNELLGVQATAESTSMRDAWTRLREAGAAARLLMMDAAAATWGVPVSQCRAIRGRIEHRDGELSASYSELAAKAAEMTPRAEVPLKLPSEWTLIGTAPQRLDTPAKVSGTAGFGLDVRLPGMLFATIYRCPAIGSRVRGWQSEEALQVPGVLEVLPARHGVAVVATSTWSALRGRAVLEVSCRARSGSALDTGRIVKRLQLGLRGRSAVAQKLGDVSTALAASARTLEAIYLAPFQAHAGLEPTCCTASVESRQCALYVPTQAQEQCRDTAMKITGLAADQVSVTTTLLGGGYGRRLEQDFVVDAVELSAQLGKPVQVIWTREDDFRHDYFRPMTLHRLRGGVDAEGQVIAWFHRIVGPSVLARMDPEAARDGIDGLMVQGAVDSPYSIPDRRIEYRRADTPVPIGSARGNGYLHNAFAGESFMDELAAMAGLDGLEARRRLLAGSPRHLAVLERVIERSGWKEAPGEGRGRGLALVAAYESLIAAVAEVSIHAGRVRVHRVTCAVDCGQVVNQAVVRSQIEGGVVFGLTAALKGEITFSEGRAQQEGFGDYPLLRLGETPEVLIDLMPSERAPGGVSGLGVAPVAPAVANAVFNLTGQRIRTLPLRLIEASADT